MPRCFATCEPKSNITKNVNARTVVLQASTFAGPSLRDYTAASTLRGHHTAPARRSTWKQALHACLNDYLNSERRLTGGRKGCEALS